MALEGLHHITAITGDAPRNVDFYGRALGLRLVKKTVNFDRPEAYHLYYGDERGTPGSLLTFFEFGGAAPGRHGDGMPYRIAWRVAGDAALDFWSARLEGEGVPVTRAGDRTVHFADPEGLEHELVVDPAPDAPLVATRGDISTEHALLGLAGLRTYASDPRASAPLLDALGFDPGGDDTSWNLVGDERRARWSYDAAAAARGSQGAGSIHHSGVLFELATRDIGFDVDEPLESLGAELKLPAQLEPDRARLERLLTPIADPSSGPAGPS
jgi:glyoxalase family protein